MSPVMKVWNASLNGGLGGWETISGPKVKYYTGASWGLVDSIKYRSGAGTWVDGWTLSDPVQLSFKIEAADTFLTKVSTSNYTAYTTIASREAVTYWKSDNRSTSYYPDTAAISYVGRKGVACGHLARSPSSESSFIAAHIGVMDNPIWTGDGVTPMSTKLSAELGTRPYIKSAFVRLQRMWPSDPDNQYPGTSQPLIGTSFTGNLYTVRYQGKVGLPADYTITTDPVTPRYSKIDYDYNTYSAYSTVTYNAVDNAMVDVSVNPALIQTLINSPSSNSIALVAALETYAITSGGYLYVQPDGNAYQGSPTRCDSKGPYATYPSSVGSRPTLYVTIDYR